MKTNQPQLQEIKVGDIIWVDKGRLGLDSGEVKSIDEYTVGGFNGVYFSDTEGRDKGFDQTVHNISLKEVGDPQQQEKLGIVVGYEPENKNGLFESEKYRHIKVKPIFDKLKPQQQESWREQLRKSFDAACLESMDEDKLFSWCLKAISTERQRVLDEVRGLVEPWKIDTATRQSIYKKMKLRGVEQAYYDKGQNHTVERLLSALKEIK